MIGALAKMGMLTMLAFTLAACVGAGRGLETTARSIDRELTTATIAPQKPTLPEIMLEDIPFMLSALTNVPEEADSTQSLRWENVETGARGVLTASATTADTPSCRAVTTTRESFEGINLYQGEACRLPSGSWFMKHLEKL
ncbi:hypothetical protein EL18_01814 [Nitratireductor basaltis]|uniref:Surface antigen domain-containing protein n=2 Tax=Nitratireductor basaltis TaxID=472175 RepID=A0A084UCT8_9HYPH|nr:hypothetical protein EL18_01814 [Nitratireductor basaltis]